MFNIINDTIVVVSPINGGPSQKLGIQSGDRIVMVDSINVASIGIENNGVIKKLAKRKEFEGKVGQQAYIASPEGLSAERLYLVGCGKSKDSISNVDVDKILNSVISSIKSSKSKNTAICFPSIKYSDNSHSDSWFLQKTSTFLENKVYTYDAKLNKKNKAINHLKKVNIYLDSSLSANKQAKALKTGQVVGRGMNVAKDLANLPGNICTPSYLASTSRSAAKVWSILLYILTFSCAVSC
mgnify:CR=1 FL=1